MELLLILIGIILFFIGLGMTFGSAWAWILADLFSLLTGGTPTGGPTPGGYGNESKQSYKGSKNQQTRFLGIGLIIVGLIFFFYGISIL